LFDFFSLSRRSGSQRQGARNGIIGNYRILPGVFEEALHGHPYIDDLILPTALETLEGKFERHTHPEPNTSLVDNQPRVNRA